MCVHLLGRKTERAGGGGEQIFEMLFRYKIHCCASVTLVLRLPVVILQIILQFDSEFHSLIVVYQPMKTNKQSAQSLPNYTPRSEVELLRGH